VRSAKGQTGSFDVITTIKKGRLIECSLPTQKVDLNAI
tara:strand:+ start:2112 stop:2225 length:114 start_codon:yes stop_codon:yes gene_type:complete